MDDRIVQFIAGLRAAGVRVSLAESQDAFFAVTHMGAKRREGFKAALRATLIKDRADFPIFDKLFPFYFGSGGPPLIQPQDALTPDQARMLEAALRALAGDLSKLLRMLASGQAPSREELEELGQRAGVPRARRPGQQHWITREMLRKMGLESLVEEIERLLGQLAAMGMSREGLEAILQLIQANREALAEQVSQFVGQNIAMRLAETEPQPMEGQDLSRRPFDELTASELNELRRQVSRLAARLRSRAALRQKRGKGRVLDSRRTMRGSLHTSGVPFQLHWKKRRLKPKLTLICDVSTSMRPAAEFLLRLMYELQDQVAKARSFAFIDHMEEVSDEFISQKPGEAIPFVLHSIPPGYYNTDLGMSLDGFCHDFLDAVDRKTTLLLLGDGRNNHNDPRLDLVEILKRRARKIVWFNPEQSYLWGTGDSDMLQYVPLFDSVHQVSNLAELAEAVDHLFTSR